MGPSNPIVNKTSSSVSGYINPLFSQNWRLFAPDPPVDDLNLIHRCEIDGDWGEFKDLIIETRENFNKYRIPYIGKHLYIYDSLTINLFNAYIELKSGHDIPEEKIFKILHKDKSFLDVKNFIRNLCISDIKQGQKYLTSIQFSIERKEIRPFSKRRDANYKDQINSISFPEINLNQPLK